MISSFPTSSEPMALDVSGWFDQPRFSDFKVTAFGRTFYLHRIVIAQTSYFEAMLTTSCKEADDGVASCSFDDELIDCEAVEACLRYIYDKVDPPIISESNEGCFKILATARMLMLGGLVDACVRACTLTQDHFLPALEMSARYSLSSLEDVCRRWLQRHLASVAFGIEPKLCLGDIPLPILSSVLSSPRLQVARDADRYLIASSCARMHLSKNPQKRNRLGHQPAAPSELSCLFEQLPDWELDAATTNLLESDLAFLPPAMALRCLWRQTLPLWNEERPGHRVGFHLDCSSLRQPGGRRGGNGAAEDDSDSDDNMPLSELMWKDPAQCSVHIPVCLISNGVGPLGELRRTMDITLSPSWACGRLVFTFDDLRWVIKFSKVDKGIVYVMTVQPAWWCDPAPPHPVGWGDPRLFDEWHSSFVPFVSRPGPRKYAVLFTLHHDRGISGKCTNVDIFSSFSETHIWKVHGTLLRHESRSTPLCAWREKGYLVENHDKLFVSCEVKPLHTAASAVGGDRHTAAHLVCPC